jgi:hypothetical protein
MVFPEVVAWVMIFELIAYLVATADALLLTFAAVLDPLRSTGAAGIHPVGAIVDAIRTVTRGPIARPLARHRSLQRLGIVEKCRCRAACHRAACRNAGARSA